MALRWYLFRLISAIAPTCKESPDTMRNVDIFFTRTNAKGQTELAVKEGFHVRTRQFPEQGQLMCAYSGFFMRCPRESELHEATLEDACKAAKPFPMHKAPNGESCINVEKNEHEEFNNEPMYHGEYTFLRNFGILPGCARL